eukprot:m.113256 g.113256  ORF g.113256 m.113256 type:complete len:99 (-) comp17070_c0_seq1:321-617(-)
MASRNIASISARIFGNVVRPPNTRSPTKYARKFIKGDTIVDYFNEAPILYKKLFLPLRAMGIYTDESRDWREEQLRAYKARGKILTKKGEGKRQKKRR